MHSNCVETFEINIKFSKSIGNSAFEECDNLDRISIEIQ